MADTIAFPRLLSINWLRERYCKRELTPREVVTEIIARVTEDKAKHAWITAPSFPLVEPYLTKLEGSKPTELPLWGIPFAIKDNIDLAGVKTTAGCPEYAYLPEKSATVVERLIAAGAIPIGKTNLDQFATGLVGTRSPYGEVHNALQDELISGGSSSGSAVAVAMGHASFALATDTAGSGRIPAALHHLVGYKPSLGAWPVSGVVPACASIDCVTVLAGELDEALLVDQTVRGLDEQDPWSRTLPSCSRSFPKTLSLPREELTFFWPVCG